jgi:hypothetical protein
MIQGCAKKEGYDLDDGIDELEFSHYTQHVSHGLNCGSDTLEIFGPNIVGNDLDTNQGVV